MYPQKCQQSSTWMSESLSCWSAQFANPPIPSHKVLYPVLPGLLDCDPFRESPDLQVPGESAPVLGSGALQVPGEIQHLVDVLSDTWRLLCDCQLHPEISSQLIGYLFYFINASLFNSLMERGTGSQRVCRFTTTTSFFFNNNKLLSVELHHSVFFLQSNV